MRFWMMAAAAMAIAAPASAQVTLTSGQGVAVMIGDNGKVEIGKLHPASLGPHDLEALDQMRISYKMAKPKSGVLPPVIMDAGEAPVPAVVPGKVEIIFVVIGDKDSVLALVNGYDSGVTYRARITARGRTMPTDVCLVLPNRRGYEHWPYAIDKIELTEFEMQAWKPGDPLPCR